MRRQDLAYDLPDELIAQQPMPQRRDSRLLVVDRATRTWQDSAFSGLARVVHPGDVMVFNDARVVPARIRLRRDTGGRIDGLWIAERPDGCWTTLLRGAAKVRIDESLSFEPAAAGYRAILRERHARGACVLEIEPATPAAEVLARVGRPPLPPYIKRQDDACDAGDTERYQTVYARTPGAVAAPTAGLHFDDALLEELRSRDIELLYVTLDVGLGTFTPIEADDLAAHDMHEESYAIDEDTLQRLARAREAGRRIVAVGTTSARVLESTAALHRATGRTRLFIYPPYRFQWVDALITNFHLPESTLLAMIYAFGGTDFMKAAYAHAIEERYRFFSYGDAMMIL